MKTKFSTSWKGSESIRKQRKYRAKAPLHIKRKMLSAHFSKELREKYHRRAFVLKKGDMVKVMKGEFKGKEGKIIAIETKKNIVFIEGLQKTRKDGTKVNIPLNPSNLLITNLNLEDKKRIKSLERKIERGGK